MLAGGGDAGYRAMLATGGAFVYRLEAWRDGARIDTGGDAGVTVLDGSLSANLDNRVTRKMRLTMPRWLFGETVRGGLLDPLSTELVLWCGWRPGAGPPWMWQVFTGPVVAVSRQSRSASFNLDATDRVEQIIEDKFTVPVRSGAGALVTTRIKDLISDSQPGAVFGAFDETFAVVPELTWEADRAGAIDDLAAGVGCHWYQLPDGRYTLRRVPWGASTLAPPVVTFTEGVDLHSASVTRSRTGVYTICQVSGEAANGNAPLSGTAQDEDAASPTYVNGPLGRRVLQVREDSVATSAQAESLARQRLRRGRVQVEQLATTMLFDPSMELGDVATITTEDGSFIRALAGFSASLKSTPTMTAQWRSPGDDEQ